MPAGRINLYGIVNAYILRISINEFLAGEDIGAENVIEKSDSNLIQITKESKRNKKFKNYITAVDQTSTEMKTAELLSGTDGAYLFHYFTKMNLKHSPFMYLNISLGH